MCSPENKGTGVNVTGEDLVADGRKVGKDLSPLLPLNEGGDRMAPILLARRNIKAHGWRDEHGLHDKIKQAPPVENSRPNKRG